MSLPFVYLAEKEQSKKNLNLNSVKIILRSTDLKLCDWSKNRIVVYPKFLFDNLD